jgi:Fic family protein
MDPAAFENTAAGRLVKEPGGFSAFVPNPLPPGLEPSWALTLRLSNADRALAELAGVGRSLPNPRLLIRAFVRREAVLSSRIEGTQASLSDLFFFEAGGEHAGPPGRPPGQDVREVANYVAALEHGLARLTELPLSLRLIREMHGVLLEGVRGAHPTPGEFRRTQNWIGPPGCTLADAVFVPPPVSQMEDALTALERFLHESSVLPSLVRLAMVHYQLEAIHPFLDGNGRIGRLLIALLLRTEGLLEQPLLYLSAFFETNRDEYYSLLLAVSQQGAWEEWISFFLRAVDEQARDARQRATTLLDLRLGYRRSLEKARASALLLTLVDGLLESPVLTVPLAARRLGVTHRAATLNVRKLVEAGILEAVPGRERNRLFVCRGILDALDRSPAATPS